MHKVITHLTGAIIIIIAFLQCKDKQGNESTVETDTVSYHIAPIYGDSIFFKVSSSSTHEFVVQGQVEGFENLKRNVHELYFQRFVDKKESFRRIHVVGTSLKTSEKNGELHTTHIHFDQFVSFDEAGIFEGDPGDPVDLIPLYPGRRVKKGETWQPRTKIKTDFGTGEAVYYFKIDSVYKNTQGSTFAHVIVNFNGKLKPVETLAGYTVTVKGGGWFVWNCNINQRSETHLYANYIATNNHSEVRQHITLNDSLAVFRGKLEF